MAGLSGQNVKILVDGIPVFGRQGTTNEININQIDVNSIQRIEIVEGPMSVIYGADALAGVINIITTKVRASDLSVSARLHEESIGSEYGIKQGIHNQYASLGWRRNNWEAGGGIGRNYFGGWQGDAVGRELTWHKKDQVLGNVFVGYTNARFSVKYRLDGLDEIITNPGNFSQVADPASGDTLAHDQEYLSQRLMQQLQASFIANNKLSFQLQSAYTTYSRQVFSTTVNKRNGDVRLDPAEGSQSVAEINAFTFRTLAVYKMNNIFSFQPGVDINLENGEGERLKSGSNSIGDYAFFITSEITPTSRISIRPGLRFIHNSVYNAPPVIPSINSKFVITRELDFRLAYARGFRSPSLRELYFDFQDANHSIFGNPDLKAEQSHSLTGSLNWNRQSTNGWVVNAVINGYYNDIENMIDFVFDASTPNLATYGNIARSRTGGGSLAGTARNKNWNLGAGISYTGFYNTYSASDKSLPELQWSPEANLNAGYHFQKLGMDVNFFYKFTGKKPSYTTNSSQEIVLSELEDFHMADLTISKNFNKRFKLNAGVRNLFDVKNINSTAISGGVHTPSGSRSLASGRSIFVGLAFNWEK
jgi:outer membrane receptor for ferrienterochelin and colicins